MLMTRMNGEPSRTRERHSCWALLCSFASSVKGRACTLRQDVGQILQAKRLRTFSMMQQARISVQQVPPQPPELSDQTERTE